MKSLGCVPFKANLTHLNLKLPPLGQDVCRALYYSRSGYRGDHSMAVMVTRTCLILIRPLEGEVDGVYVAGVYMAGV